MSRRRYIGTGISTDERVADLSDSAALLWTWMIPHAEDDATITGSVRELKWTVVPSRDWTTEKVAGCLDEMLALGLIASDGNTIYLDSASFYAYQTYIPEAKRVDNSAHFNHQRESAKISEEQRETPKNAASLSPSPSLSPSITPPISPPTGGDGTGRKLTEPDLFAHFWQPWPKKDSRAKANAKFRKLSLVDQVKAVASVDHLLAWQRATGKESEFIPGACVWLNQRRFELWWHGPPDGYQPQKARTTDPHLGSVTYQTCRTCGKTMDKCECEEFVP